MNYKLKKVYYCDFCKKKGLSASSISQHEKHCTLNIDRECRMCDTPDKKQDYLLLMKDVKRWRKQLKAKQIPDSSGERYSGTDVEKFRKHIERMSESINCPACTFTVLRLALHKNDLHWASFNLREETMKYWEEKNQQDAIDELYY